MNSRVVRKVLESIDEQELTEFTREIARIPSVHGDEKGIAQAFANRMVALGIETELVDAERNRPNVLGWVRGSGEGQSLTLNGHIDTVFEVLGWTKDPYGGVLEDGKIYGHGVSNMKASDTAMVYAAAAIKRAGVRLKADLLVALVVGECQGGIGTRDLMKRGIKTAAFICGEPTYFNILTVHAAAYFFRINITGRTGHFGTHDHGLNAIMKMYGLVNRLGPMHEELKPGWWITFQKNELHRGLPRYQLSTIRGGLTKELREGGGWSNTPDFCTAVFNVRTPPNKSVESTRQDLENVLKDMQKEEPEFQYEVLPIRDMPGFQAPPDAKVPEAVAEAYREVVGGEPNVGAIQPYMFMGSDSGNMQAAGMTDGALIGPGNFTSSVPDEHVEVAKLVAAAKIYAVAALRICGYHG